MNVDTLINNSKPFLEYVLSWEANLPELLLKDVIHDPSSTAIVSVDVINGFCCPVFTLNAGIIKSVL